MTDLDQLIAEVRACRLCAPMLPLGPRPIVQVSGRARLLIASQAPGARVHEKGLAFWDDSGNRLRDWLGLDREVFYDPERVAILPMGFCYPGRLAAGGDRPPRPECAPLWRDRVLALMPAVRLTLLVGTYAQAYVLGPAPMTGRVRDYRAYLPRYFPLPHPSWRTNAWAARNPWFAETVLPALRAEVACALDR